MFKVQPEFLFVNKSHHITVQNNPCIFLQRRQLELFVHVLVLAVIYKAFWFENTDILL